MRRVLVVPLLLAMAHGAAAQSPKPCDTPQAHQLDFWLGEWSLAYTEGGKENGRMVFTREAQRGGQQFLQRMVFEDVTPRSLRWSWQRSDDAGRSWKTQWEIAYRRER